MQIRTSKKLKQNRNVENLWWIDEHGLRLQRSLEKRLSVRSVFNLIQQKEFDDFDLLCIIKKLKRFIIEQESMYKSNNLADTIWDI